MIDITDVRTHSLVKVRVELTGAPEVKGQHRADGKNFVPGYLAVDYTPDPENDRWMAVNVSTSGPLVLKPGPDGEQRLGMSDGKHTWGGWSRDVQEHHNPPEWLDQLINELRPSGNITLPGGG